jgi:DNA-binding response OmpR family regulator
MAKLLVIEDEDSLRDSITDLIEAEGHEVLRAENGSIGVQLASEQLPDLVLCDIMMPVLDGHEVLSRLRSQTITADLPFIFLTARTDLSDLGLIRGSATYLTKPFTRAALLKAVVAQLERRVA